MSSQLGLIRFKSKNLEVICSDKRDSERNNNPALHRFLAGFPAAEKNQGQPEQGLLDHVFQNDKVHNQPDAEDDHVSANFVQPEYPAA